jgi:hypothetical protein
MEETSIRHAKIKLAESKKHSISNTIVSFHVLDNFQATFGCKRESFVLNYIFHSVVGNCFIVNDCGNTEKCDHVIFLSCDEIK